MNNYYNDLNTACEILDSNQKKYPGALGRKLFVIGLTSLNLFNFYMDLKSKIKKKYFFENEYEISIAKIYIKLFNSKIYKSYYLKKKFFTYYKIINSQLIILIFYFVRNIFFNTFVSTKKKKIDCLFFWDKYKYINLFKPLMASKKKSYLLLHNNSFYPEKHANKSITLSALNKLYINYNNKFDYHYNVLKKTLLFYQPKTIIFAEGDSPVHSILSKVCKNLKIKSICLQWGSSTWKKPKYGFRNLTCDKILVHGKFFREQIKNYNKIKISVVGNPLLTDQKNFDFRKKAIFMLQPAKSLALDEISVNIFFDFMKKIILSNKDWKFIIRLHPQQDMPHLIHETFSFSNSKIISPKNVTLTESVKNCAVAFSISSSSLTDVLNNNIIPFAFNVSGLLNKYQPDINKLKIGIETKNFNKAIYKAQQLLKSPRKLLLYRKNIIRLKNIFIFKNGKKSVKEIFKHI